MSSSNVIKVIRGLEVGFGGEEHSGWLPPGAAEPVQTPVRVATLDVRIEFDGHGYLLIGESRNTGDSWDTWHETLEGAEEQAERSLGIRPSDWQAP